MIETFLKAGTLNSPAAFIASLLIGIAFGVALEKAGFGSSRRLAGIFYFRDMTVLKVMFTAVVFAMLGICYARAFGWVTLDNVHFLSTVYAAQIVGGLIFGAGFVMSGWCPGTGAVGLASGKIDALVFLLGAVGGSMLYNELYPILKPIFEGDRGVVFAYDTVGVSQARFAFSFTVVAVLCFWGSEYLEKKRYGRGRLWGTPFLVAFSAALILGAAGLFAVEGNAKEPKPPSSEPIQQAMPIQKPTAAPVHMGARELADRLLAGDNDIMLVDMRTPEEFERFHIRSAVNLPVENLPQTLLPHKNKGLIVLYSNGAVQEIQTREDLSRLGFENVSFLSDGLKGFLDDCLKPISLRTEPVSKDTGAKINAWRAFFLAPDGPETSSSKGTASSVATPFSQLGLPGLVETEWLNENLQKPGLKIIDLRTQPEYNGGHIPGSVSLNPESLRGLVDGTPSSLLPAKMLAEHFKMMGIAPDDLVVLVASEKPQDATLAGMACERLKHERYAVLNGGFPKWQAEKRPIDTTLPRIQSSRYPVPHTPDTFTVTAREVLSAIGNPGSIILDVRPVDFYSGKKKEEARGGHIPGAINRPFSDDVAKTGAYSILKPVGELQEIYGKMIPTKDSPVIVHCRTGHQASQTYFILVRLLGYTHIGFYDAGWTEWAARPELPVE